MTVGPAFTHVIVISEINGGVVRFLDVEDPMAAIASERPPKVRRLVIGDDKLELLNKEIDAFGIGSFAVENVPGFGITLVFKPEQTGSMPFVYLRDVQTLLLSSLTHRDVFGYSQLRVLVPNPDYSEPDEYVLGPGRETWWLAKRGGKRCFSPEASAEAFASAVDATAGS